MDRRDFLATSFGTVVAGAAAGQAAIAAEPAGAAPQAGGAGGAAVHPRDVRLCVKPVMVNLIHTAEWQGPCRWDSVSPQVEKTNAEASFARWSKQLKTEGLGRPEEVRVLEPVHVTFTQNWTLKPEEWAKLMPDSAETDVFFMYPSGNSRSSYEIGAKFGKPIVLNGLGCRNTDIACFIRAKGNEAFVAGDDLDLTKLLSLLRARKVFRQTKVLYPTNGVPPFTVGSVWDFEALQKRLGVSVKNIPYKEMIEEMNRLLGDRTAGQKAEQETTELVRNADKLFLDEKFVVRSMVFDRCIRNLLDRHGCNSFTIDCFEFCPSMLPQQWMITPCLLHAMLGNEGIASSCEADFGSLLAVRLLISVSNKSPHQGNGDPRDKDAFRINHSAPSMKMNGLNQPDLPYQLGRFVQQGWGTKAVIDFMNNQEKTVTVARVDATATKVLVLKGTLVGSSGWGQDLIGCSVEAVIQPPPGRRDEFLRRRLDYGNHLQWVYGDYTKELKILGEMLGLGVEVIA
jgi:hypothetical protein